MAINKVQLSKVISDSQIITSYIYQTLLKLCHADSFTSKISEQIGNLEKEILACTQAASTEPQTLSKHILRIHEIRWLIIDLKHKGEQIIDQVTELQKELILHLKIFDQHIDKAQTLVSTPEFSVLDNVMDMCAQVSYEKLALTNLKEELANLLDSLKKTHQKFFDKL